MSRYPFFLLLPVLVASRPAVAQEAASSFSGPRIEASVGLDQLRFDLSNVGSAGRSRTSDLGYGAALGYDIALSPSLVAGLEAGVNLSDAAFTTGDAVDGGYLRKRRELTLAGRLGAAITPNALLYGKLGYANLQVRESETTAGVVSGGVRNLDGLLVGAGAEVKVSPNAYLKSEYRYTDYRDGYSGSTVTTGVGLRF